MLTGAGFTLEEVDELFKNRKRRVLTPEQRRQHLAALKRANLDKDCHVSMIEKEMIDGPPSRARGSG